MKLALPEMFAPAVVPELATLAAPVEVVLLDEAGQSQGPLDDVEVLVRWWFDHTRLRELIGMARGLRWLHTPSAGVDGMLFPELRERGIVLTNAAGTHAPAIAEFVMLAMLSRAKQLGMLLAAQRERRWVNDALLSELTNKTLLIVGLGSIGQELARRAAAFDMRVLGSRRSQVPVPGVSRVVGADEWRGLLCEADFVVIAAPLTDSTRGMVEAQALAAMRPDAYLINIARGEIIDEAALIEALREGRIGGALLDAFAIEPLPAENPLWELPTVTVTPHISWSSPLVYERNVELLLENLRRYLDGRELLNIVDQSAGY